jgi:hypothetical protein
MSMNHITEDLLLELEQLSTDGTAGPWRAYVEGRDHTSGDSFILTGTSEQRGSDLYVTAEGRPVSAADLDLIAAARTFLPALVREVRRLRDIAEAADSQG